jgi:hypothetical protein
MNSERNVWPSVVLVERVADLDRQLADPGNDRARARRRALDDLSAGLDLELVGAALGARS